MVCRCGYEWTGFEPEPAAPVRDGGGGSRRRGALWVGPALVVLALAVAGGLLWRSLGTHEISTDAVAPAAPEPAPAPAPADGSAIESTAAPEPAESARTYQWPADLTIWKDSPDDEPARAREAAPPAPALASARPATLEDVIERSLPAVVLVQTPAGRGTGFFVSPDTVITNAHVVEGHTYVSLRLANGASLRGRVVRSDDPLDLAAIQTADALPTQPALPLSPGAARVGQEVIAIGSPLGLQNTVTRGIVSALRQAGTVTLVQTDAAINPGNSGGPLLDRNGEVVAVATMRVSGRAEALGFGVAAGHIRDLLDNRSAPAAPAPAARPDQAFAPGAPDGLDGERESAEAVYERFLVTAAQRADQLDRSWTDFVRDCLGGRAPTTRGDRGWFALFGRFDDSAIAPGCVRFYADFKFAAQQFNERMTEAAEGARRAGVYPGVCRTLRQRYRVDWSDW